jgi:tyrosine-protein phosphatase
LNLGQPTVPQKPESPPIERHITIMGAYPDDAALMSPRVETMTNNPIHDGFNDFAGMRFVEVPPTPSEGLFSPRETMFPRDPFFPFGRPTQNEDPRSPPTKGETPIVRSIDDVL